MAGEYFDKIPEITYNNVLVRDVSRRVAFLKKSIEKTSLGSIVLFHDQQKTSSVLPKILPTYLDEIQDKGWKTATL